MNKADKILLNEIAEKNTPSVQYFIFNKDSIIHSFQSGLADIKNNRQISSHTTYNVFSVTKTFTALAVLQLAEQKKLDINAPVKKYIPDFPYSPVITVKQLLAHTAGIPNPIPVSWVHLADEHEYFDRKNFFRGIFNNNNKTKSEPNEEFAYSNLGYVLLGDIIENVTGISYEQYVNEYIIKKLGLKHEEIGFTINDTSQHAKGYIKRISFMNFILGFMINKEKFMGNKEGEWKPFRYFYVNGTSYGGLISTPAALVKYIQELLKPDCILINDDYKEMMFTENFTSDGKGTKMCLSWFKGNLKGKQYFAHAGGGGGYYCEIRIYPEIGLGSVIVFNRTGMSDERFLDKVDKYFIND